MRRRERVNVILSYVATLAHHVERGFEQVGVTSTCGNVECVCADVGSGEVIENYQLWVTCIIDIGGNTVRCRRTCTTCAGKSSRAIEEVNEQFVCVRIPIRDVLEG